MNPTPQQLFINHVEMSDDMEWSLTCEEILGGTGRATLTVQDRLNSSWIPQAHWDVKVVIRATGWVLFRGEIITPTLDLPVGFPWRKWVLDCSDYNNQPPQRLVGAPSGYIWGSLGPVPPYDLFAEDGNAISGSDDKGTIQSLIRAYLAVDGATPDVTRYVQDCGWHIAVRGAESLIWWNNTTLQAAIDEIDSYCTANAQDWLDPDLYWHHQAIPLWWLTPAENDPGSLLRLFPEAPPGLLDNAPAHISDTGDPGTIGCRGLSVKYDGSTMPQAVYVQGATGFVYNGGAVAFGGTGWANNIFGDLPTLRQVYLSDPVTTTDQRDAAGGRVLYRGSRPTLRGQLTVSGTDGWRCGQVFTLTDARLPDELNGHTFVIQGVHLVNLIPEQDVRVYQIDWGDGPTQRYSAHKEDTPKVAWPAVQVVIDAEDPVPQPLSTQTIVAHLADSAGLAWKVPGRTITWQVIGYDTNTGLPVDGQGSIDPVTSVTDNNGVAKTTLTAGDQRNISYFVYAETPAM